MARARRAQRILDRYRPLVDDEIRSLLPSRGDTLLYEMIRYHLGYADIDGVPAQGAGGKRVRSALCLLACEAAGGDARLAAPAGAALELVHSFTLLHDDIADRDEMRRGRTTVWKLWGIGHAITAGDALYALANLAASRLSARTSPDIAAAVLRELNQAVLEVCEGQELDISYEKNLGLTDADYMRMIGLKTAALFRATCGIGARVAGAGEAAAEALREFGAALGLAYQIRDDILGIWGDPGETGKPVGGDLRQNKRSLPIVLALRSEHPGLGASLLRRLSLGVPDADAAEIAGAMEAHGIRAECERRAKEHLARARESLVAADLRLRAVKDLRILSDYLAERTR